jgi:hypothetical protein
VRDGTRLGLLALAVAASLGLLGDLLLRATPWGLSAPLWILALLVGAGLLTNRARLRLIGEGRWLGPVALFFAAGIAWRDSAALLGVNVLAVLLCLGLAAHRARGGWPVVGGLLQYVGALASAGFHACGGALVLAVYDVRWQEVPHTGWSAAALAVVRGLLIAIPLVLVFGGLFMAADAVFAGLVTSLLAIDVRELFAHLFWLGVWAWLTAGFPGSWSSSRRRPTAWPGRRATLPLRLPSPARRRPSLPRQPARALVRSPRRGQIGRLAGSACSAPSSLGSCSDCSTCCSWRSWWSSSGTCSAAPSWSRSRRR